MAEEPLQDVADVADAFARFSILIAVLRSSSVLFVVAASQDGSQPVDVLAWRAVDSDQILQDVIGSGPTVFGALDVEHRQVDAGVSGCGSVKEKNANEIEHLGVPVAPLASNAVAGKRIGARVSVALLDVIQGEVDLRLEAVCSEDAFDGVRRRRARRRPFCHVALRSERLRNAKLHNVFR